MQQLDLCRRLEKIEKYRHTVQNYEMLANMSFKCIIHTNTIFLQRYFNMVQLFLAYISLLHVELQKLKSEK